MNQYCASDSQKLVRRFNEDEAVWRRCEEKRLRRRLLSSTSAIPEEILCYLDWLEAEREMRLTRSVGRWIES